MTASRSQHIVPGIIVFAVACLVTWLSFTAEPAEAYAFPRIVSVFFIALAAWNLVRALAGWAKVGEGISAQTFRNLVPGVILMIIYVFWAAKFLGFYTASTIAFFVLYTLYDPAALNSGKDWGKRAIITAAFMAVIYILFALVLRVQTPRGIFF